MARFEHIPNKLEVHQYCTVIARFSPMCGIHQEKLNGGFGFHVVVGFLLTMVPVYHLIQMLVDAPGQSIYFKIHGQ